MNTKTVTQEEVLHEFPPAGKHRIRLLANPKKPGAEPVLDIREYVTAETFEGFTRRGIRVDVAGMDAINGALTSMKGTQARAAIDALKWALDILEGEALDQRPGANGWDASAYKTGLAEIKAVITKADGKSR